MAFLVYRSNRLEPLIQALAEVVRAPASPVDPLRPETVVVQSRALGRFLSFRLAQLLGAWACPDFPFPRRVIDQILGTVLKDGEATGEGVFGERRLTWAVARLLPRCLEEEPEVFSPVRRYLQTDAEAGAPGDGPGPESASARLLVLSAQIATVLDRYQVYRPDWILRWDRAPEPHWQSRLWHRLVREYAPALGGNGPAGPAHLAARAQALAEALRRLGEAPPGLPPRLHLFAIRTLPPLFLGVFASLAQVLDVHFFELTPSPEYFADLRPSDRISAEGPSNPLLASMGRLGRELQELLEEHGGDYQEAGTWILDPAPELGAAQPEATWAIPSALAVVQSDVLRLRHRRPGGGPGERPLALCPEDRSLTVHACFGPMREVEALRDALLAAFDEIPGLQPRDVVVLAPAMDAYAPYVEAVFGGASEDPAFLPYSIADRLPSAEHGVPDAFLALLGLLPTRLAAPDVLDLLARAPVRERFGIPPEGLEILTGWLAAAGIRWAVDADDRAAQGQPAFGEYSWRFGLDRLLLGYAVSGDPWTPFGGVLPLPGAEGQPALLEGLLEFSESLFAARREATQPARPDEWRVRLLGWAGGLLEESGAYAWQHQWLREVLEELVADAAAAGFDERLDLASVRALLEARLSRPSPPREFLSAGITFCSLLPMRSVPFRVVALLGLSEDQFPRQDRRPAFDLLSEAPRPGDPSPRQDDRYLFLEALLAARERLILSYVGGDLRDQTERPPSVLVSELLDAFGDAFTVSASSPPSVGDPAPARERRRRVVERLVTRHPLRPFDQRYLDASTSGGLFTYDRAQLRAARAHLAPKRSLPPFLAEPLPPAHPEERGLSPRSPEGALSLEALERFWRLPCEHLARTRLGLAPSGEEARLERREPTSLAAGLASYQVRDRLLRRVRAGGSLQGAWEALSASALLPLGGPGRAALEAEEARMEPLFALLAPLLAQTPLAPVALALPLGDTASPGGGIIAGPLPRRLTGWLRGLLPGSQLLVRAGSVRAKDQLEAWIRHLALCAVEGGNLPGSTLIAGVGGAGMRIYRFERLGPPQALERLTDLAALFVAGQQVPLRFFPQSSLAFAQGLAQGPEAALRAARKEFLPSPVGGASESEDPSVARLFPGDAVLEETAGLGPDGAFGEVFSFAVLAERVFGPLLAARREGPA